jgi:hypothetical protein
MTFEAFSKALEFHRKEYPYRRALAYDGYEMVYPNGDIYRHTMTVKPGAVTHNYGEYYANDFTYESTWNGQIIERPLKSDPA